MKRAGLIAFLLLLGFSVPAAAVSKNPYNQKARAKAPKARASAPSPANPRLAKKQDSDPTSSWQSYSYP